MEIEGRGAARQVPTSFRGLGLRGVQGGDWALRRNEGLGVRVEGLWVQGAKPRVYILSDVGLRVEGFAG